MVQNPIRLAHEPDAEQRRNRARLEDVNRSEESKDDEQQSEAILWASMAPVEAHADRAEDEVGLLNRQPARMGQETGIERAPKRHNSSDDRTDRRLASGLCSLTTATKRSSNSCSHSTPGSSLT